MSHPVLISPVVSEKTNTQTGKYIFVVNQSSTKEIIAKAFSKLYGINPKSINIINTPGKKRFIKYGAVSKRNKAKKAIISLPEGKTINFNDLK